MHLEREIDNFKSHEVKRLKECALALRLYVRHRTDLNLDIGQIRAFYIDTTPYTLSINVNTKSV